MTIEADGAPFEWPHKGRCRCDDDGWGMWCNYCISQIEHKKTMESPDPLVIFVNRVKPEPPLFISDREAEFVADALARRLGPKGKDYDLSFGPMLLGAMRDFAECWVKEPFSATIDASLLIPADALD